jgi:putative transport protein
VEARCRSTDFPARIILGKPYYRQEAVARARPKQLPFFYYTLRSMLDDAIQLLRQSPVLLLFVVIALGYPLGRVRIAGISLGVAAMLFVGIGVGALHPDLKLPEIMYILGLSLFVYTVGLNSGGGFFSSLKKEGLRYNAVATLAILVGAGATLALSSALKIKAPMAAGMFSGSLTNTPALANVLEYMKHSGAYPSAALQAVLAEPVIAYSVCYPVGVVGMIIAMNLAQRFWRISFSRAAESSGQSGEALRSVTVRVTRENVGELSLRGLQRRHNWNAVFVRLKRGGVVQLVDMDAPLQEEDRVSAVGAPETLDEIIAYLGERVDEPLEYDRSALDFRRVFVSKREFVGKTLGELDLDAKFGAIVTRVRRGDADLLALPSTELHLGDRIRVVAPKERMNDIGKFFGDSYKALSEIDLMTFGLGIAAGLIIGVIPFPLPNGDEFRLGFAGGPLIAGLILGYFGRTGALVWDMPYSANLIIRQFGLALFLAGVGTRSGYAFASTFAQQGGALIFAAGALITAATVLTALVIGYKLLSIPFERIMGIIAGLQTQPALLGYASEQTRNDEANIGYTTVYPAATIMKIILAQIILTSF